VGCVGPSRERGRSDFWSCSSSFSCFLLNFFAVVVVLLSFSVDGFLIFVWHDTFSLFFSYYNATAMGNEIRRTTTSTTQQNDNASPIGGITSRQTLIHDFIHDTFHDLFSIILVSFFRTSLLFIIKHVGLFHLCFFFLLYSFSPLFRCGFTFFLFSFLDRQRQRGYGL
jgi:hypothetical protein